MICWHGIATLNYNAEDVSVNVFSCHWAMILYYLIANCVYRLF